MCVLLFSRWTWKWCRADRCRVICSHNLMKSSDCEVKGITRTDFTFYLYWPEKSPLSEWWFHCWFCETLFEKYGFIGIKLYPALGYFPQDAKMFPLYRWCANNCVPIITHCITGVIHYRGDVSALPPVNNPGNVPYVADNNSSDPKIYQRNFTQPRNYSAILSEIPNLKICLAHYGDDKELIAGKRLATRNQRFDSKVSECLYGYVLHYRKHGDFSGNSKSLSTPVLEDRVLFGTDYYVVSKAKLENELVNDFRSYMIQQNLHTLFWNLPQQMHRNFWAQNFIRHHKSIIKNLRHVCRPSCTSRIKTVS